MAEFKEALTSGKEYEYMYRDFLRQWYPNASVKEVYCKEYDIVIPEINQTVEVKLDKKSNFTGNMVVEVEFNGKPSGLTTTTADHWVFCDGKEWIRLLTERLKGLVNQFEIVEFVGNGDIKPKKAYLVDKEVLREYADKVVSLH